MDLRRFAGLGRERSDEEVAETETGGDDAIALVGSTWRDMSARREQADLLSTTDEEGLAGAARWLDARGYAWCWVPPHHPAPRRERRSTLSPDQCRQARAVLRDP